MNDRLLKLFKNIKKTPRKTLVCAHRGNRFHAPENTIPAFQKAIDLGVDAIEFDIRLTLDKRIVIFHDESIDKGNGVTSVHEMTLKELKSFDLGIGWERDLLGIKIPSFEEGLDVLKKNVIPIVEIKSDKGYFPFLESELVKLLNKVRMLYECIISSFDLSILERLYGGDPKLNLALISKFEPPYRPDWLAGYHPGLERFDFKGEFALGHQWCIPWTVNREEDMETFIHMGVDGIITDYPERLLHILKRKE